MDPRTHLEQDPTAIVLQCLDVCRLACSAASFKNESLIVTTGVLLRLVQKAAEGMAAMSCEQHCERQMEMAEACSMDLLEAIGLAKVIVSAIESEAFMPDGPDRLGLDAVLTLLKLAKSGVDAESSRLVEQSRPQAHSAPEAVYMAGVTLAIEMLRVGDRLKNSADDGPDLVAEIRSSAPQNNYARSFLEAVIERPDLVEGFSAVISGYLGVQVPPDTEVLARLTYANIMGTPERAKPTRLASSGRKAAAA